VILGYAWCPFCGNSVLVPRCDFIRHDPLRGNPALVPVCEFIRHACGPLYGNGALGAISFALPVALSAAILVRAFTMQLRLLCLLHSLRRCSAGHTMRLLATPVAFSVAIHACPTMRFHSPGPAPRQSSACCPSPRRSSACSCMRFSLAMPVALSAAFELLMRFHSLPSRRKSCAGLRVLVFRAPLRAAIHAGFFSAFRAVLGSQSVRPLPGLSYSGVGWVCIEPLRCSASVGISA